MSAQGAAMKPDFRMISSNGVTLRVAVAGEGPLVLMAHGFPESWYSWRHQLEPLAAAGFTACAIDVRGYGGSDKPHPVEAYAIETIAADVAGVVEALSPNAPAVLIGHDWGAPIVWSTALFHPERVRAVCGLSVPYIGVPARPFMELIDELFTKRGLFFYQVYFQEEGVAEAECEADLRGFVRKCFYAWSGDGAWPVKKPLGERLLEGLPDPDPMPAWMSAADVDYYVGEFQSSGLRGPLNRYRNNKRDWESMQRFKDAKIIQPALFIAGERDPVLKMFPGIDLVALMAPHMADLRAVHSLPGVGHWTQQEAPDAVTGLLIDWLATV
jgi:epoxide hydrolase A/B